MKRKMPPSLPQFKYVAAFALAFLYAPILVLVAFSFNAGALVTVWEGFSAHWYAAALANEDLRRAALNSVVVAAGATVISTLIALPAALALHEKRGAAGRAAGLLLLLPLLIPEIVIAVSTMAFFALLGVNLGIGNVLAAHVAFCVPFAYAPVKARLSLLPGQLLEAAGDLYAPPWERFRTVTLPLLAPGISAGALLSFIISLDDFAITQMVAPPGAMTLPVYIYSMVRRGVTPEINAISALLLVFSMAGAALAFHINRNRR